MSDRLEKLPPNKQAVRVRGPFEDLRCVCTVEGESQTDNSHGNDTDINKIIARFDRTGVLPGNPGTEGQFADVSGLNEDLGILLEKSKSAMEQLAELEAEIEERRQQMGIEDSEEPAPPAPEEAPPEA